MGSGSPTYDVFLSYDWRDRGAVEQVAQALRDRGLKPFLDRWYLNPGQDWMRELERILGDCAAVAVFVGSSGLSPWQQRESGLALVRKGQDEAFPVIPVLLPDAEHPLGFLSLLTWVDLRQGVADSEALGLLAAAAKRETLDAAGVERIKQTIRTICPYRGLQAFREEDAAFFCGREAFTERLVGTVAKYPMVAVVGPSGSGKSSVVRAGLVPYLRQRGGSVVWEVATLTPGTTPLARLVGVLAPPPGEFSLPRRLARINEDAELLRNGRLSLAQLVEAVLKEQPGTNRLLLIVDQWEELYTQTSNSADRQRFVEELLNAARCGTSFSVVLTVRGDFFGRVLENRALADNLQGAVVNLSAMNRDELARAIIEPSGRVGLDFEPGLTDRILDDVGNEPGNLPLLEFLLTELWQHRARGNLTHAAFESVGGISKALAHYADGVAARFTADQNRLKRIFVQLVRPGEGTEDTRQVATREQLGESNWPLVKQLADARLVVTGSDDREGTTVETAEVVHEALIRHWQPLRQWIDQDRQFRVWQNRLRESLKEWHDNDNDEGALLRGARLLEAEERLRAHRDDLSASEREYLEASAAHQAKESVARHRVRRALIASLSLGLIAAGGLSIWAINERDTAQQQVVAAENAQSAAEAQRNLALTAKAEAETQRNAALRQQSLLLAKLSREETARGSATTGMLLALEALPGASGESRDRPYVYEAEASLWAAFHSPHERWIGQHSDQILDVAFSPTGQSLATASLDGTARIWDTETGELLSTLEGHQGALGEVAYNPDGTRLATASDDNTARIWDAGTGKLLKILQGHQGTVYEVEFLPNGAYLATASRDETVAIWDTGTGQRTYALNACCGGSVNLAVSPDGARLAASSWDGNVYIWDTENGQQIHKLRADGGPVNDVVFSHDGTWLATGGLDGVLRIWDTAGNLLTTLEPQDEWLAHSIFDLAIDPSGRLVAGITQGGKVTVWNIVAQKIEKQLELLGSDETVPNDSVWHLTFSPDGKKLAMTLKHGNVLIWDFEPDRISVLESERWITLVGHTQAIRDIAFSPDGQRLATASYDHTIRLWDLKTARVVTNPHWDDGMNARRIGLNIERLVTISSGNKTRVWTLNSDDPVAVFANSSRQYEDDPIALSPDNMRLATSPGDNTVRIWDVMGGRLIATLRGHTEEIECIAFSLDGRRVATSARDDIIVGAREGIRLWDASTGQLIKTLNHDDNDIIINIYDMEFSPDGHQLAVAVNGGVILWNVETGEINKEFGNELGWNGSSRERLIAFEPDGARLAAASNDAALEWDVASGSLVATFATNRSEVSGSELLSVAYSPDASRIATLHQDHTTRLWDAQTKALLAVLRGDPPDPPWAEPLLGVAFGSDGGDVRMATWTAIWIWETPPLDELISTVCDRLARDFSTSERKRFYLEVPEGARETDGLLASDEKPQRCR
jgi:WD40 repeat protein